MSRELRLPPPNSGPQREFFLAKARFVAYGGARGGGKSWAVRIKSILLAGNYAGIRILILRRTFPELRENHILPLRKLLHGVAVYKETDKSFSFPNGSRIVFGYCAGEGDVHQYQGQEYDIIFMDEATHFSEMQFAAIATCLRGANPFPKRMYLTCNPGGVGHMWVKRLFVDREFRGAEKPEDHVFIRAKATDNPALVENDPGYLDWLNNLPDGLREAWRDGRWDVFAGQYFPEFRPETHAIAPRELPAAWPRYRVMDYGLDMLACYWAAIDYDGRIWVYRELCRSGLKVSDAARVMKDATPKSEKIRYTIAPPDMWSTQKDTGRTMAEIFSGCGVNLAKASNRRVHGWLAVKEFLQVREDGLPGLLVFEDCTKLIRDMSAVQHDEKNPNDVATQPHEYTHSPDALRYLCVFHAAGAQAEPEREEPEEGMMDYDDFMLGSGVSAGYLEFGG